jgi:hypothetical protein
MSQQPEALRLADAWDAAISTRRHVAIGCEMADELRRLHAENEALRYKMALVDYVLQDDIHNRLTPRVVDIAYSAFTFGRRNTPHDWFNDTKPMVMEQLSKIQKHLAEEAAHGIKP